MRLQEAIRNAIAMSILYAMRVPEGISLEIWANELFQAHFPIYNNIGLLHRYFAELRYYIPAHITRLFRFISRVISYHFVIISLASVRFISYSKFPLARA